MDSWLGSRMGSGAQTSRDHAANLLSSDMSELYNDEYRDFSVKPLNFQEEAPHKYTSVAKKRAHLSSLGEPKGLPRYSADQNIEANPRKSMSNRVLLSSQGERIIKIINKKDLYNPTFLLSNFDREKSQLVRQYDSLVSYFEDCNLQVQALPFPLNLYEKHEIVKDHALRYLESKLDVTKLRRDIPAIDWDEDRMKRYFVSYQPSSAELSHKMITEQSTVALKKYKNCLYFGGVKGQIKQGYGVLIHFSGKIFEGEFKDDHKAEGVEIDDDCLYVGQFKQGQYDGKGFYKRDTDIQCGLFSRGQWANRGVTLKEDSILFQYREGLCVERNLIGDIFVGEFNGGQKSGLGLQKFSNEDMYIGRYEDSRPEGYGQYYWSNIAVFMGQFVGGLRHGHGVWHNKEGDMYEGTYENDKKSGQGIYRWHNGTEYRGSFMNDYRHGYGQMYWADGRIYKGMWTNGIENAKKLPIKRLTGFLYPRSNNKRNVSHSTGKNQKLPNLTKAGRSIDYEVNREWKLSTKQLPKGGIKALYNPNYNFEY